MYADEYPIHAVINKQDLISAIKRVSLVAERNAPIRMAFTSQELTLTAGSVDEAQAKEILDIDMDGEDITVAFNPAYLIEGLSAISEPFVRMKMTTGGQAGGIQRPAGIEFRRIHGLPLPARADALQQLN